MQSVWRQSLINDQRQRREQHLWRERRTLASGQGAEINLDGHSVLNFSSNDYLGLAGHPRLINASNAAAREFGTGSGASHLVSGHLSVHAALEKELADFLGAQQALLFSTGYMANLALCAALAGKGDLLLQDKLNHASLIDGGKLSDAVFKRYAHADVAHAERLLQKADFNKCLIATDGVFSMDGDMAPLGDLKSLAEQYNGLLVVDDAHGFGVCGPGGRGALAQCNLNPADNVLMMGTLGKALGSFGAFVAGDAVLIEQLLQSARSYIYTTALPPATVAASMAGVQLLRSDGQTLSDRLQARIRQFKTGACDLNLRLQSSHTAIQPVLIGDPQLTLEISSALLDRGFYVSAIRPPTVPKGTSRLRVTLSASHTPEQVEALLIALDELLRGVL